MNIINGYLCRTILASTGLVMLVLLSLGIFIEFVGQLDDLGQGTYTLITVVQYILLKIPHLAAGLLPVSVLLGSLLGLGALAAGSELIIMQASGVSARRLAGSVALTGIAIALVGGLIAEFLAPEMYLYARQLRAVAKSGQADLAGSSTWVRDGNTIYNLRPSVDGVEYGGVYVYRMAARGSLQSIGRADSLETADDQWQLDNYQESVLSRDGVTVQTDIVVPGSVGQLGDLLAITAVKDSSLTGIELYNYVRYLKRNGLDAKRYEIAFWGRLAQIAGIAVMCVLALPFVFGSLRTTGAGARMIVGVLIGVGYFLMSRTMADSAAVFDLSPIVVAWLPTVLLALGTYLALRRVA
ncbi:MAG: LPS export ABC transporter permease LptG [Gammaproteobacteria bacterium]|jgi:lipopolysaccharide export system permease protein|nr:LPS export ABC transporter permease LptG [Gammaproteobacteria bacterium]